MIFYIKSTFNTKTLEINIPPELRWLRDNHREMVDYVWFKPSHSNGHNHIEIQILKPDVAIVYSLKFGQTPVLTQNK